MRTSDSAISGGASSWRISVDEGGVKMGLYGRHYDMVTQGRSKRKRLLIESLNAFGGMWYVCLLCYIPLVPWHIDLLVYLLARGLIFDVLCSIGIAPGRSALPTNGES